MRTKARSVIPAGLLAVLLALGACGGGGDDDDGVASIDGSSSDDTDDTDDGGGGQGGRTGPSQEFQDAMLEYAQCMRGEGIDFPDPEFNGDGMVVMGGGPGRDGGPPSQADMDEFEAADEACRHIMEAVEEDMPRPDPEQQAEMRDEALRFSECMREHGIDFPDPQFDEDGGATLQIGGPDGGGIDPSDPDFQEAEEECSQEGGGRFGISSEGPGDDAPSNDSDDE